MTLPATLGAETAQSREPACCDCACGRTVASVATATVDVSECEYQPDGHIPPHRHDRAGFCLVLEGGFEERVGGVSLRCDPAMLLFHPAGAVHANVISDRGSRCLNVEIEPAVMAALGEGRALRDGQSSARHGVAHWFAYKLRRELHVRDELTPLVMDGVALALLGEFARQPSACMTRRPPSWLERARSHLHEAFVKPPTLSALADDVGVHRVHLARAFREFYACTVGEYVRQRRIQLACERLIASDAPLSDVALSCGFADQSHFTTTFKRLVGVTPREFRSRLNVAR